MSHPTDRRIETHRAGRTGGSDSSQHARLRPEFELPLKYAEYALCVYCVAIKMIHWLSRSHNVLPQIEELSSGSKQSEGTKKETNQRCQSQEVPYYSPVPPLMVPNFGLWKQVPKVPSQSSFDIPPPPQNYLSHKEVAQLVTHSSRGTQLVVKKVKLLSSLVCKGGVR